MDITTQMPFPKSDLEIILLAAVEGKPFAMTQEADHELHEMLRGMDTLVLDNGQILTHVPEGHGTPEFNEAWQNTCEAFSAHGITLTRDYLNDRGHARSAAMCFITLRPAAH